MHKIHRVPAQDANHASPSIQEDLCRKEKNLQQGKFRAYSNWRRMGLLTLFFVASPLFLSSSGLVPTRTDVLADPSSLVTVTEDEKDKKPTPIPNPSPVRTTISFSESPYHPDRIHAPYFGLEATQPPKASSVAARQLLPSFQQLLDLYIKRQAEDDNFTIRIVDGRNGRLLETFVLEAERTRFEKTGKVSWENIDKLRREQTKQLIEKHKKQGIPGAFIQARWGRKNQILEARERDLPFIKFEMDLARYLNLSLLVTEIGTVETFNQDSLISSAGARGRYQMMPFQLRSYGIHHYQLTTAYGNKIKILEEWHPLLTMEPSFLLLRGYVNAVGHEIPGLSAYHTGPGNIFKLYGLFLKEQPALFSQQTTVLDAYVWALTEGYDLVSSNTSFKSYSRGYVPSGYGALRAVEEMPIDTMNTFLAERVQLQADKSIFLSDLLESLEKTEAKLHWPLSTPSMSLYERFRKMNPHIRLPGSNGTRGVPAKGNIRLRALADGHPVRLFLPIGATEALASKRVLDTSATYRYDHETYRAPGQAERTDADHAYAQLVEETAQFGFTPQNREKLKKLVQRFTLLADRNPTHYRLTQLGISKAHLKLWQYEGWDRLAVATLAARGAQRVTPLPPTNLQHPKSNKK